MIYEAGTIGSAYRCPCETIHVLERWYVRMLIGIWPVIVVGCREHVQAAISDAKATRAVPHTLIPIAGHAGPREH